MGRSLISEGVTAQVRNEIVAEIATRAEALSIGKGRFAALILEKWFADGCPPVTPADEALQTLKIGGMAAERPQAPYHAGRKKLA